MANTDQLEQRLPLVMQAGITEGVFSHLEAIANVEATAEEANREAANLWHRIAECREVIAHNLAHQPQGDTDFLIQAWIADPGLTLQKANELVLSNLKVNVLNNPGGFVLWHGIEGIKIGRLSEVPTLNEDESGWLKLPVSGLVQLEYVPERHASDIFVTNLTNATVPQKATLGHKSNTRKLLETAVGDLDVTSFLTNLPPETAAETYYSMLHLGRVASFGHMPDNYRTKINDFAIESVKLNGANVGVSIEQVLAAAQPIEA